MTNEDERLSTAAHLFFAVLNNVFDFLRAFRVFVWHFLQRFNTKTPFYQGKIGEETIF